jgi:hypothetical protein
MTTRDASTARESSTGATITLTDLARLAGVGRNAVSNWRRREPDFPEPVDAAARRPRFSLDELERWAERHSRTLRVTGADRLWFAIAGAEPTAEAALGAVAAAFKGGRPDARADTIADRLKELRQEMPAAELFEFFIERAREASGTGVPPGIAPLADIAAVVTEGTPAPAVHDPACDEGDLLAAVVRRVGHCRVLSGQDLSGARVDIAEQRLRLLDEKAEVTARVADSLLASLQAERYDLVVCDPPFNVKDWGYDRLPAGDDPRLAYGTPPRTEPELAWALHCVALLAPGGHAVVRMPAQVAHRRSGRRIRSELLRWGALRAVVDHPEAKAHIWILAPRGETTQLLVSNGEDFAEAWRSFTAVPNAPIATPDSATVPLMRLWDEDVDISPAVYLASAGGNAATLAESVGRLSGRLAELAGRPLPRFGVGAEESAPETSLAELERDGHLVIAPGGSLEFWPEEASGEAAGIEGGGATDSRGGAGGAEGGGIGTGAGALLDAGGAQRHSNEGGSADGGVGSGSGEVGAAGGSGAEGAVGGGNAGGEAVDNAEGEAGGSLFSGAGNGGAELGAGISAGARGRAVGRVGGNVKCVIVDPVGEPPVRIGWREEATEMQWTVACEPTVDLGWIAAVLAARLPTATKRTATGAKRRILSVKIPRLPLQEQQRRGAAFARLEEMRSALKEAGEQAGELAAEAAAGLASGAVTVED